MKVPTLKIRVAEVVQVREGTAPCAVNRPALSPYFQPQYVFTMANDEREWAPVQSRAPSVLIGFDLFEAATG